jgi:hypothetical protein
MRNEVSASSQPRGSHKGYVIDVGQTVIHENHRGQRVFVDETFDRFRIGL